jgi:hypothetical protein
MDEGDIVLWAFFWTKTSKAVKNQTFSLVETYLWEETTASTLNHRMSMPSTKQTRGVLIALYSLSQATLVVSHQILLHRHHILLNAKRRHMRHGHTSPLEDHKFIQRLQLDLLKPQIVFHAHNIKCILSRRHLFRLAILDLRM